MSHPATLVARWTGARSEWPPAELLQHLYGDIFDLIKGGSLLQPKQTEPQPSRRPGS